MFDRNWQFGLKTLHDLRFLIWGVAYWWLLYREIVKCDAKNLWMKKNRKKSLKFSSQKIN